MPVFGPLPRHTDKNAYFWKHNLRGCCSASVHQNKRAAGKVWLSGSFSDRQRQKCLFLDLCLGTGKNACLYLEAPSMRVLQCKFIRECENSR